MDTFRAARAAMLARAYPEATAGEPLRWEWDRDTAGFDLDVRPDPRVHAPTVISLPVRSHYPDGYEASVLGGDVVSAPGARKLEVEASPGAETLRVHVQPAPPG
jgi:endoglycosylceramidase